MSPKNYHIIRHYLMLMLIKKYSYSWKHRQ